MMLLRVWLIFWKIARSIAKSPNQYSKIGMEQEIVEPHKTDRYASNELPWTF
jgi:hypothetical protein